MSDDDTLEQYLPLGAADLMERILQAKKGEPNKFQSFWEMDEEDVEEWTAEEIENDPVKRILWAAENDERELVRQLVMSDPHLANTQDSDRYTPLHRASYNGHAHIARILLEAGAETTTRTSEEWTPLHSACRWGNVDVASLLLHNNSEINAQTGGGQTPLHLAAAHQEGQQKETLELLLLDQLLDSSIKNELGETAAELARRSSPHAYLFEMIDPAVNSLTEA